MRRGARATWRAIVSVSRDRAPEILDFGDGYDAVDRWRLPFQIGQRACDWLVIQKYRGVELVDERIEIEPEDETGWASLCWHLELTACEEVRRTA